MDWYSVKLLYRATIAGEPDKSKLDEHWEFDQTLDCFRLADAPGSFVEVYSSIFASEKGRTSTG